MKRATPIVRLIFIPRAISHKLEAMMLGIIKRFELLQMMKRMSSDRRIWDCATRFSFWAQLPRWFMRRWLLKCPDYSRGGILTAFLRRPIFQLLKASARLQFESRKIRPAGDEIELTHRGSYKWRPPMLYVRSSSIISNFTCARWSLANLSLWRPLRAREFRRRSRSAERQ